MHMLVLTRKSEEKIIIGEQGEIEITVLKIQGGKVSIGIKAPETCKVLRYELTRKDRDEEQEKENRSENVNDEIEIGQPAMN